MADTALAASLRLKANTGLAARVIRVAKVNAFIGRDLVGHGWDGLGNGLLTATLVVCSWIKIEYTLGYE
jgi:hypothetical protein